MQVDEKMVAHLLPYLLDGVKCSAHRELRLATYMAIMQLISRSIPAPQLFNGMRTSAIVHLFGALKAAYDEDEFLREELAPLTCYNSLYSLKPAICIEHACQRQRIPCHLYMHRTCHL